MRIQVLSDLHIEFNGDVPPVAGDVDVLVCAGDLHPYRAIDSPATRGASDARMVRMRIRRFTGGDSPARAASSHAAAVPTYGAVAVS